MKSTKRNRQPRATSKRDNSHHGSGPDTNTSLGSATAPITGRIKRVKPLLAYFPLAHLPADLFELVARSLAGQDLFTMWCTGSRPIHTL